MTSLRACKKCGGPMIVTTGIGFRSFECRECHFVLIEPLEGIADDAATKAAIEHAD